MKLFYASEAYHSHARAADVYYAIVQDHVEATEDPGEATVIVLHGNPNVLRIEWSACRDKYLIGYMVWEANTIPIPWRRNLERFDEIWTPSRYCADAFSKVHPNVVRVPHVVERPRCRAPADRRMVEDLLDHDPRRIYFLFVTDLWARRKNTRQLVDVFRSLRAEMPDARLVVKNTRRKPGGLWDQLGPDRDHMIFLDVWMSEAQMNALYEMIDVYVSPHHAEGWGLAISDAMLFEKLVVLTGHSGPLEYASADNAFLVDYRMEPIRECDRYYLFDETMEWAYPDADDLARNLLRAYSAVQAGSAGDVGARAGRDIQRFSRVRVGSIIGERLRDIVEGPGAG